MKNRSDVEMPKICPLLSAGAGIEIECKEERCAWYIKNEFDCSIRQLASAIFNNAVMVAHP